MTRAQTYTSGLPQYRIVGAVVLVALLASITSAKADDEAPALGWTGQIALGGSLATGNTDRQALDLDSRFQLQSEHRQDRYKLLGDLAREKGVITAQRTEAAAQSNYDLSRDKFYILAFTQFIRDRFSGFSYEAQVGPGLGYRIVHTERLNFAVELASGYRYGALRGAGGHESQAFARGTAEIEYKLSDNAQLTNEALVTGDIKRVKIEDTFSVTSTLIRDIAARVSVNARYNSDPPVTVRKTDTLSKVSLVYAF